MLSGQAGRWDDVIEQNATWARQLVYLDDAGDPVDLTGYTATMTLREAAADVAALALTSSPAAGITLGGAAGTIAITMTAAQTMALRPIKHKHDLLLVAPGGGQTRLLEGFMVVSEAQTRG